MPERVDMGVSSEMMSPVMVQRREDVRRTLDKLTRLLSGDIPASERTIVLRRYEALRQEAHALGVETAP